MYSNLAHIDDNFAPNAKELKKLCIFAFKRANLKMTGIILLRCHCKENIDKSR